MNKFSKVSVVVSLCLSCNLAWADKDRISGVARADFHTDELTVPCVEIQNYDDNEALNDQFFDIILKRRGKSFNYELTFAASEDQAHCQSVADFAAFEDDDFDDSSEDEDASDDSAAGTGTAKILVSCDTYSDRSKISVNGKDLVSGDYSATVTSGGVSVSGPVKATVDNEIEFDFDSDETNIAEGATAIDAGFIQGGTVDAQIIDDSTGEPVITVENVACSINQ